MKKDIAEKWIKALRSGDFAQGTRRLSSDNKFCCLGVLCVLAVNEQIIPQPKTFPLTSISSRDCYGEEASWDYLPKKVKDWAGLKSDRGIFDTLDEQEIDLTVQNDTGVSFSAITDLIEANISQV